MPVRVHDGEHNRALFDAAEFRFVGTADFQHDIGIFERGFGGFCNAGPGGFIIGIGNAGALARTTLDCERGPESTQFLDGFRRSCHPRFV
jgi:hypothetical protein